MFVGGIEIIINHIKSRWDYGEISRIVRKFWLLIVVILILIPMTITAPHVLFAAENPEGTINPPTLLHSSSDGFVLIILDGVGEDILLDQELMPYLNSILSESAILKVETGPLTLSATCVKELMTGVPNSPVDGLKNFNLKHPGGHDPWTLAANDHRYSVGMVGSYVMGNMYGGMEDIHFVDTFQGHADYNEGDIATAEIFSGWISNGDHNVISAHFSGPDKVGHKWGIASKEYEEKMQDLDAIVYALVEQVPDTWSIVITADHGMTESGSHGSAEEITREVAAIVSGPNIKAGSESSVHQRDISALIPAVLNLPFPVQLHGRIPLDILQIPVQEIVAIERWNWEASYNRQEFINSMKGNENNDLSIDEIEWEKIPVDGIFSRTSDIILSIINWIMIATISIIAVVPKLKYESREFKFLGMYYMLYVGFVYSHASLSYSAMIPRGIGAACAVWVVAWSLSQNELENEQNKKTSTSLINHFSPSNMWLWCSIVILLLIILRSFTQSLVLASMVWVLAWSIGVVFGKAKISYSKIPEYGPWLLAIAIFTFGSIRLWFSLIPLLFIIISATIRTFRGGGGLVERIQLSTLSILILSSVTLVHRRLIGHWMLKLVNLGTSFDLVEMVISILLLLSAGFISTSAIYRKIELKSCAIFSLWLLLGFVVSAIRNTAIERIFLFLIVSLYLISILVQKKKHMNNLPKGLALAALSMQMLLTWGAWAASVTMIIISSVGIVWELFKDQLDMNDVSFSNPKPAIALAVLPWVIWILWWTLLGQVNGVQTCFEGICPHPRELDPGSVIVSGGYLGASGHPSTIWMFLMVASPLVIASSMIMYEFRKRGLSLQPYIISQMLIVLGCASLLSFSPEYPRLVFSLTWNASFAILQIIFSLLAIAFYYFSSINNKKLNDIIDSEEVYDRRSFVWF